MVATRIAPLVYPPARFVVPAPETSRSELAILLGEHADTGVAFTAHSTADGQVALAERATIGRFPRRRALADLAATELPDSIVTFAAAREHLQAERVVYLRAADQGVLRAVRSAAASGVWASWVDLDDLAACREDGFSGKLVHRTRLHDLDQGPERHGASLAAVNVDAVEFPFSDWTGGLTTLYHRFGVACVSTDVTYQREFDSAFDMGIDAIVSRTADAMQRSFTTFFGD